MFREVSGGFGRFGNKQFPKESECEIQHGSESSFGTDKAMFTTAPEAAKSISCLLT